MIPIGSRTALTVPLGPFELARPPVVRYPWLEHGAYALGRVDDPRAAALVRHVPADDPRREVVDAWLLVLGPGDYVLAHHDPLPPVAGEDLPLELMADLSPRAVPGADVHYRRRGAVFFAVPSAPGTLSIVERGSAITANHVYVSRRWPAAEVVRLIVRTRTPRATSK